MKLQSLLAYFPVFGWFITMFAWPNDHLSQYHARQGLGAVLFYLGCSIILWILTFVMPFSLLSVSWIFFAAVGLVYLYLLVRGAGAALRGEERPLPIVGERAQRMPV